MRTITTTIRPDREIEVDDAEFLDLKRQGLIATGDDEPETETPAASKVTPKQKETPNA